MGIPRSKWEGQDLGDIVVRQAVDHDLPSIAALHKEQFGDHFLGQFSVSLLTDFYREFLGNSIFLIAKDSNATAGFVLGGQDSRLGLQKKQFLRSKFFKIFVESVFRPRVWGMIVSRLIRYDFRNSHSASEYEMRLLSIAVDHGSKGKGVASTLVVEFEKALDGCREYGLSVLDSNSRAVGFYRKTGYSEEMRRGKSVYFFKIL